MIKPDTGRQTPPDASASKGVQDVSLPGGVDLSEDDILVGRDDDGELVALDDSAQGRLELALEPPILHKDAVRQPPIALLHPAQVVLELPRWQRPMCTTHPVLLQLTTLLLSN